MAGLPDIPPGYQDLGAEIVGGDRSREPGRPEPGNNDIRFDIPPVWHRRCVLDHFSPLPSSIPLPSRAFRVGVEHEVFVHPGIAAADPPETGSYRSRCSRSNYCRPKLTAPLAPGKHRRFANRVEVLEGPFERRIQQFETEIDFGLGRRQWRGNAHDPIGCARCVRCWRSVRMQRILGDRIRKRASKVLLAAVKRLEFYSQEQVPPRTSPIQAYLC
jgi:hypothetical protein